MHLEEIMVFHVHQKKKDNYKKQMNIKVYQCACLSVKKKHEEISFRKTGEEEEEEIKV